MKTNKIKAKLTFINIKLRKKVIFALIFSKIYSIYMRFKKPLASTLLFAAIFIIGILVLYILVSEALETDINTIDNSSVFRVSKT
ncbi:MAG: hypothetical protein ACJAXY_001546 [Nonlabens sp.]